ncbi:hypothetical protein K503DRAFT_807190 [Rhizopogon vinicolor AM-OR11-026]|uniref:Uncharacterized protein n=1 Tax=Rhizopogon vinicolor AM-OR11-026 TaxID=1314800 RepID=A0A1B7MD24_9AGAM|nr:hypothetical protein K503DRAFT_807190 [Rhizopogon vinicolor AM-OR11-026]
MSLASQLTVRLSVNPKRPHEYRCGITRVGGKVHGAMGWIRLSGLRVLSKCASRRTPEVVSSIDSSPEIPGQAQVVTILIIRFTLENKLSGMAALVFLVVYGQR